MFLRFLRPVYISRTYSTPNNQMHYHEAPTVSSPHVWANPFSLIFIWTHLTLCKLAVPLCKLLLWFLNKFCLLPHFSLTETYPTVILSNINYGEPMKPTQPFPASPPSCNCAFLSVVHKFYLAVHGSTLSAKLKKKISMLINI